MNLPKRWLLFILLTSILVNAIEIRNIETPITPEQAKAVQDFYLSVGYTSPILHSDKVVIALQDNKIIGAVRLSFEHAICVLRGMQIASDFQRKGIGTQLIKKLDECIGSQVCWCLPHNWLESFYQQIGFRKVDEAQAPDFLQERITHMRKQYPALIFMVKNK